MTNQEKQEIKLIREKATDILVDAGMETKIGAGIFSRTKLNNLNDEDFFNVLDIINSTHQQNKEKV